ncbi:GDP-mannose 3,5-epimerase 1-like [Iris pallida]|uniref:GDP-mannose 3,5-epimerase 1-like n=1 Tax=Iris pallida TaxID=29817 RepID=A0AAX6HUY4_IRIPA|nr:GDP-mannose 3,5-epimerase 1-like [Iris pallida]KAJ6795918.1 GDP-mannose 3,5-epimerase 1-like [Iris pallida]KAJ6795919.1 GDP-mannose 3,5-epimerase 1-like [Iris pallida]KAJ6826568.1 GDP-mannose 3,5-epimerase 1-like [Iris pallida]KAJ6832550.1 GDP-mannose 3,5-epimerase 1-like [Iris pallida]
MPGLQRFATSRCLWLGETCNRRALQALYQDFGIECQIGRFHNMYGPFGTWKGGCVPRLTKSDFREPVNIGSDEMVCMNEMAEIVLSFEDRKLSIHHIPGPEGVRGCNSDNTLISWY